MKSCEYNDQKQRPPFHMLSKSIQKIVYEIKFMGLNLNIPQYVKKTGF